MTSAVTSFVRALARHRLFAVLNIGGLALGIATFLVLLLVVRFETGYDRGAPGWERIWIVQRSLSLPGVPVVSIPTTGDTLADYRADYPGTTGTRLLSDDVALQAGTTATRERLALVDANYFALFPYPVVAGDPAATLRRPDGAIVTQSVARRFLGDAAAIGRTLTLVRGGKTSVDRVGAVIADLPAATSQAHDVFVALPPGDADTLGARGLTTYLRFPDAATAAARAADLPAFVRRHPDPAFKDPDAPRVTVTLEPLSGQHLREPRDRAMVVVLAIVGALALLVAVINYVNLATARAGLRAREVAIRKVTGGTRAALARQFLGEAIASAALAALVGLALAELALPLVNGAGGTALEIRYGGAQTILLPVLALIVGVGLIAGAYPAIALSRFQPAGVLASARAPLGSRRGALVRRVLVVVQFAVATALIIATLVLVAQTRHMQTSDLGFRRDRLIVIPAFADTALEPAQQRALQRAIGALPGVVGTTASALAPTGGSFGIGPMRRLGAGGAAPMIVRGEIGPGFFDVYGARLLAGRLLDADRFALDEAGTGNDARRPFNLVLNRTAVLRLGFASPESAIGQALAVEDSGPATIVGVIADMRLRSPHDPVDPFAYKLRREPSSPVLGVRFEGEARPALERIASAWRRLAPAVPLSATTADQSLYDAYYRGDAQRARLFTAGAALAAIIGCIGLYGLAAFETERRRREIGIRKALGASMREVLGLLLGQFLRPVVLAVVLAWPLAWWPLARWLAGFDDRVTLSPLYFAAASLVALTIAALTVLGHAARVARAAPATALRYE